MVDRCRRRFRSMPSKFGEANHSIGDHCHVVDPRVRHVQSPKRPLRFLSCPSLPIGSSVPRYVVLVGSPTRSTEPKLTPVAT